MRKKALMLTLLFIVVVGFVPANVSAEPMRLASAGHIDTFYDPSTRQMWTRNGRTSIEKPVVHYQGSPSLVQAAISAPKRMERVALHKAVAQPPNPSPPVPKPPVVPEPVKLPTEEKKSPTRTDSVAKTIGPWEIRIKNGTAKVWHKDSPNEILSFPASGGDIKSYAGQKIPDREVIKGFINWPEGTNVQTKIFGAQSKDGTMFVQPAFGQKGKNPPEGFQELRPKS